MSLLKRITPIFQAKSTEPIFWKQLEGDALKFARDYYIYHSYQVSSNGKFDLEEMEKIDPSLQVVFFVATRSVDTKEVSGYQPIYDDAGITQIENACMEREEEIRRYNNDWMTVGLSKRLMRVFYEGVVQQPPIKGKGVATVIPVDMAGTTEKTASTEQAAKRGRGIVIPYLAELNAPNQSMHIASDHIPLIP